MEEEGEVEEVMEMKDQSYMRECISVHVGQAGSQMGNACWELYCLEHGQISLSSFFSNLKMNLRHRSFIIHQFSLFDLH